MKSKKMLGLFSLASLILFASMPPLQSLTTQKDSIENFDVKTLYDSEDNQYCLLEYKDKGYKILNDEKTVVLEESDESFSPYKGINNAVDKKLMYYGPMNYYLLQGNTLCHTVTNETIPLEQAMPKIDISRALNNVKKLDNSMSPKVKRLMSTNYSHVANFEYITGIKNFAYNSEGTCGYVAAAICLYYCYRQYNTNFIPENLITYDYSTGEPNGFTKSFHDELVSIGSSLGIPKATDAFSIEKVMKKYASNHSLNYTNFAQILSYSMTIDECIRKNKPCILFGLFQTPVTPSTREKHAVTLYGTLEETFTGAGTTSTNRYFCVNFGWSSYTSVRLLDNLFSNPVASFYNINP